MNEKFWTLPNLFTLSRVAIIPFVYWLTLSGQIAAGLLLLLVSLLTDFMDGYVARKTGQVSSMGALLDPVADKAVILAYLTIILIHSDLLPLWFVALTYLRNIAQLMSIPILIWWLKIPFKVKPKQLPKWATGFSFGIMFVGMYIIGHQASGGEWMVKEGQMLIRWFALPISTAFEVYILVTYVPRLYQIATGSHDTFE